MWKVEAAKGDTINAGGVLIFLTLKWKVEAAKRGTLKWQVGGVFFFYFDVEG